MSSVKKSRRGKPKDESVTQEIEGEVRKIEKEVKKGARKVEKAVESKAPEPRPAKPSGRAPQATVTARRRTSMIERPARGFSLGELSGAGLAPKLAMNWGARIDPRRRSVIEGNMNSLRAWNPRSGVVTRVKMEAKKVEEKLEEAAEEVEREAAVVVEGAGKAEKKVKRVRKKAEGAAREKAEKPKARTKKKGKP